MSSYIIRTINRDPQQEDLRVVERDLHANRGRYQAIYLVHPWGEGRRVQITVAALVDGNLHVYEAGWGGVHHPDRVEWVADRDWVFNTKDIVDGHTPPPLGV